MNFRNYSKEYIFNEFSKIDLHDKNNIELLWAYLDMLESFGEIAEYSKQLNYISKNINYPEIYRVGAKYQLDSLDLVMKYHEDYLSNEYLKEQDDFGYINRSKYLIESLSSEGCFSLESWNRVKNSHLNKGTHLRYPKPLWYLMKINFNLALFKNCRTINNEILESFKRDYDGYNRSLKMKIDILTIDLDFQEFSNTDRLFEKYKILKDKFEIEYYPREDYLFLYYRLIILCEIHRKYCVSLDIKQEEKDYLIGRNSSYYGKLLNQNVLKLKNNQN
ncbi:hypothetical protein ND860_17970 [Leptospira levettii]|uniref:hypothetical protein n=1 Tax=Leptospira levettii TaxID=2023178 RepID=UPI00223DE352|nr:hypothetical protein [Leptospira levettii]MCW7498429.1 hypothetical protein [Leptospira levettii]